MKLFLLTLLQFSCLYLPHFADAVSVSKETNNNETDALEFLKEYNVAAKKAQNIFVQKKWNFKTDKTECNYKQFVKQESVLAKFLYDMSEAALKFNQSAMSPDTQRQLAKVKSKGTAAQSNVTKLEELLNLKAEIETIYGTAKVCLTSTECLSLKPDITNFMAISRDYDKLLAIWVGWQNATGREMKEKCIRYTELINESSRLSGFKDYGEQWRSLYESDTLQEDVDALYEQIRPLYEQLHAYVRRKLKKVYGESRFPPSGHIPAHILGDLWAQRMDNIYDIVVPFENKSVVDVTSEMINQQYTVHKMFKTAEDFFLSLGLEEMTSTFWNRSIFETPNGGKEVFCMASSWDFYDKDDFRVKMCAKTTYDDLITAHHEIGHIQYFMQYKDQPFVFREPVTDAFNEVVGDLVVMSAQTPEHLKKLGLVNEISTDNETDINFLMQVALLKVAFLPLSYLIEKSRWRSLSGLVTPENYNKEWWDQRCGLQGISPPIPRSKDDFDAGANYHSDDTISFLRYFLGFIIQFQLHEAACRAANHTGPLHRCDIYNSKVVGDKLREVLKLGSSKPWPQVMKMFTGQDKIDAKSLLDYFQPLMDFLRKENGNDYGWDTACPFDLL